MTKIWNSKIFWFIIIFIVLYWYFAPVLGIFLHRHEGTGLRFWSPPMLVIAFILAFIPFLTLQFFPTSWLTKIIIKTKKVFKIIFLSLVPFLIIFYSLWYLPDIALSDSASYKTACSYIRQDTTIINKIGTITEFKEIHTEYILSSDTKNAVLQIFVLGQKGKAIAEIRLTNNSSWTVDNVEYNVKYN